MEKLMPSHNSSYDSYRYQLLKSTKTKRLETWDNEYAVHYLVDDNADPKDRITLNCDFQIFEKQQHMLFF